MLLAVALVAAAFTSRSSAQEPEPFMESPHAAGAMTIDVAAYANLCGRWEYRHREGGSYHYWHEEILGTRKMRGEPIYFQQSYDGSGHPNDQSFLHADLSKGLFQAGHLNDYGDPTETTSFWKPKLPMLMKSFVPGKEYTSSYTKTDLKGKVIKVGIKTESERISVPYGSLDCYKVTQKITVSGKVVTTKNTWYAKHLGVVRHGEGVNAFELASYEPAPWLVVEQPAKSALFDGVGKKSFGTRRVGKPGVKKTFTVRNLGTKELTGLSISTTGSHAGDFTVSAPASATLAPGKATTFTVTFAPKAKGSRKAAIHISHAESKGNPFDIQLAGMGAK